MQLAQLSVSLENQTGRLAEMTDTLAAAGINLRALTLSDTSEFLILRLIVDDTAKALKVLKAANFTAKMTEVVAVEVNDQPGALAQVLHVLDSNRVDMDYMYAFVEQFADKAVLLFRFKDQEKGLKVLSENNIRVLTAEEVEAESPFLGETPKL
jgi:hypothetical protein